MTSASRPARAPLPQLADFSHVREDRLRLTDLDFQKHVNNAAQTALLANARFDFLGEVVRPQLPAGDKLVIASLQARFVREMFYDPQSPQVYTGTRIQTIGNTSMVLEQAVFQNGQCALHATCVFVHLGAATQAAAPWPAAVQALRPASSDIPETPESPAR